MPRTRTHGIQVTISTELKKDHAAQRGRDAFGTATRISASLFRRFSAFFGSTPDQAPKAAKLAVLIPGPGMFVNVRNAPRVVIAPHLKQPLFHRVSRCVHDSGMGWRVYPPQPLETNVAAFVGEVERCDEKRFETAL